MTRALLVRGMLAGLFAAVLAFLFARWAGEPQVDLAIAVEALRAQAAHAHEEPELVSRAVQKGLGLFTGVGLYGSAVGGLFALAFALAYGRVAAIGPRALSLWLATAAFVAVTLMPALKYPPTPPAVGLHETVAFRTEAYFGMMALSLAGLVLAIAFGVRAGRRLGPLNGALAGVGAYLAVMVVVHLALPAVNEVPKDFPAVVLWDFRVASIGMQALLWTTLGVTFGWLAEQQLRSARSTHPGWNSSCVQKH